MDAFEDSRLEDAGVLAAADHLLRPLAESWQQYMLFAAEAGCAAAGKGSSNARQDRAQQHFISGIHTIIFPVACNSFPIFGKLRVLG